MKENQSRRQFFHQSFFGLMAFKSLDGVPIPGYRKNRPAKPNKIQRYNKLGRTGFKVSDIAFGNPKNEAVLKAALDAGVNYLDTGEEYGNGNSERTIGSVIKDVDRSSIFINTKLRLKNDESKENILDRARKCLERLNTEYIDCLMIHNATDVQILDCEGFHGAARQLKEEGRLRFIGITSHGTTWWKNDETLMSETMEKVCMAAAEDGRFDVFLFIYNYLTKDMGERILKALREKNIGATLMKVNPVHNYTLLQEEIKEMIERNEELTPRFKQIVKEFQAMVDRAQGFIQKHNLHDPREISRAAFRFVMNHPGVHTVCCQMPNFDEMEHWLSLSGSGFSERDKQALSGYKSSYGQFYCRHACGICEEKCPQKIPINTIMRYHHYFDSQKREKEAMVLYSKLSRQWNDGCQDCDGYCEQNCPYRVPIQTLLELAHHRLSLD